MEKKLKLMIEHIENHLGSFCDCRLCDAHQNGTFLDGLTEALKLIPKRNK